MITDFKDLIEESIRKNYLTKEDIDFIVSNGEKNNTDFSDYFDKAMAAPLDWWDGNVENEKKLFAKFLFSWMRNYNPKLLGNPETFAMICFKAYSDGREPAIIEARKDIKNLL